MKICLNCGHEITYVDRRHTSVFHRKYSNQVFPHYNCTEECNVKGCNCKEPKEKKE